MKKITFNLKFKHSDVIDFRPKSVVDVFTELTKNVFLFIQYEVYTVAILFSPSGTKIHMLSARLS